jgi:hypothetical protein
VLLVALNQTYSHVPKQFDLVITNIGKGKGNLKQAVKAQRVVRPRGSHIFQKIGSQLAVRLSASQAGRPLPQEDSWYSFLLEAE